MINTFIMSWYLMLGFACQTLDDKIEHLYLKQDIQANNSKSYLALIRIG
jgi:hypothetical protein